MLDITVVTLFPEFFAGPLAQSIPARAAAKGLVRYRVVDLRAYTHDRHQTADDEPYGGGAGMVLRPEPFFEALDDLKPQVTFIYGPVQLDLKESIYFSNQGKDPSASDLKPSPPMSL